MRSKRGIQFVCITPLPPVPPVLFYLSTAELHYFCASAQLLRYQL